MGGSVAGIADLESVAGRCLAAEPPAISGLRGGRQPPRLSPAVWRGSFSRSFEATFLFIKGLHQRRNPRLQSVLTSDSRESNLLKLG